jgi:FkbM family methyltransferase
MYGRMLHLAVSRVPTPVLNRLGFWEYKHPLFRRLARRLLRPMQAADTAISQGPGSGLRFRSAGGFPGRAVGMIEPEVQSTLDDLITPGDAFYDLGANVGFFTLLGARLVGPSGHVIAVEPQPAAVEGLRHNVELNGFRNVTVIEAAVSDVPGQSEFHVSGEGILEWGALGPGSGGVPTFEVRVTTVDALLSAESLPPPSVVKLDVEGAEAGALRGMTETLTQHRPRLICEIHGTLDEVVAVLESAAYDIEIMQGNAERGDGYYGQLVARPRHPET